MKNLTSVTEAQHELQAFELAEMAIHELASTPEERNELDRIALEAVEQLEESEDRRAVLQRLFDEAGSFTLRTVLEQLDDNKFGKGIYEGNRADVPDMVERMLNGKNSALIIRKAEWRGQSNIDPADLLIEDMAPAGEFSLHSKQAFPNRTTRNGSSTLHLDLFSKTGALGYRYTLSASRVEQGSVLFVAGLAKGKALNLTHVAESQMNSDYNYLAAELERLPAMQRQFDLASAGRLQPKSQIVHNGTEFTTVILNEGDIVLWPQGGPLALGEPRQYVPAWHAFRQIGSEPRQSTSYHFIKH